MLENFTRDFGSRDKVKCEVLFMEEWDKEVSHWEEVLRTSNEEAHGDLAYVSWGEKCL
jgi:hypothetical protein